MELELGFLGLVCPGSPLLQIHLTAFDYIISLCKDPTVQSGCQIRCLGASGNQMYALTWKWCQAGWKPCILPRPNSCWFGSHCGFLLSSFLNSLRLGQPDMCRASLIEGSAAELAVLSVVERRELGLQPVSSIFSLFADLWRNKREAQRKCRKHVELTKVQPADVYMSSIQARDKNQLLWASLRK